MVAGVESGKVPRSSSVTQRRRAAGRWADREKLRRRKVGEFVELRLTYQGELPSALRRNNRTDEKHAIRRAFHPQLRRFWQTHSVLKHARSEPVNIGGWGDANYFQLPMLHEHLASKYERFGYNFVPLARAESELICSINILFIRVDVPGSIIKSGDIDNRLKVLFDAMRMPENENEVPHGPSDDEKPFYVLLEDDKLITHVSVETDTLLEKVSQTWNDNDVRLVISVKLKHAVGMMPFD